MNVKGCRYRILVFEMPSLSESRLTGPLFTAVVLACVCTGARAEGAAVLHVDHLYVLTRHETARKDLERCHIFDSGGPAHRRGMRLQ